MRPRLRAAGTGLAIAGETGEPLGAATAMRAGTRRRRSRPAATEPPRYLRHRRGPAEHLNISTATSDALRPRGTGREARQPQARPARAVRRTSWSRSGLNLNLTPDVRWPVPSTTPAWDSASPGRSTRRCGHVGPVRATARLPDDLQPPRPADEPGGAEFQLHRDEPDRHGRGSWRRCARRRLGTNRTLVVCGNDQLDEVALWGRRVVFEVRGRQIEERT